MTTSTPAGHPFSMRVGPANTQETDMDDRLVELVNAAREAETDLGAWVTYREELERDGFDVGYTEAVRARLASAIEAFLEVVT